MSQKMSKIFGRWVFVVLCLIRKDPIQLKHFFVFNRYYFDEFAISFLIKRRLSNQKLAVIMVLDFIELMLNLFSKDFDILLTVDNKSHQIRRIFAVIKSEEHFSEIGITKRFFIPRWELIVRMPSFSKILAQLVLTPWIILQIFRMLRMYSIELPLGWRF